MVDQRPTAAYFIAHKLALATGLRDEERVMDFSLGLILGLEMAALIPEYAAELGAILAEVDPGVDGFAAIPIRYPAPSAEARGRRNGKGRRR